jgi:hypothetical protein
MPEITRSAAQPLAGTRWRHFKGGLYEVVLIARAEASLEPQVVYRSLQTDDYWTRPLSVWLDEVSPGVPRFKPDPGE